ncbi:MAG: glutamate synthase-related protein [Planctomycetia bacterium]|nr:glutamate synthase-related protein [Planctomycetia bacterium]
MGNDAALPVLSERPQSLFNYFRQLFAQVTNPPIDPIREELVMSLTTYIGNQGNILSDTAQQASLIRLKRPILTEEDLRRLEHVRASQMRVTRLITAWCPRQESLGAAVERLQDEAVQRVRSGYQILILSDRALADTDRLSRELTDEYDTSCDGDGSLTPIPILLATTAVNRALVEAGLRPSVGLIVESGEVREVMHFALLLGYGATAICPYLALETIASMVQTGQIPPDSAQAAENYILAADKGLLRILSKMGISTLRSYRSAQIFEAVGLDSSLIDQYFPGTVSRIGGVKLDEIAEETLRIHRAWWGDHQRRISGIPTSREKGEDPVSEGSVRRTTESLLWAPRPTRSEAEKISPEKNPPEKVTAELPVDQTSGVLPSGGLYRWRRDGENHLWNPQTLSLFRNAVQRNDREKYREYARLINDQAGRLCTLRGLMQFTTSEPVPLDEVEPVENILRRFVSGAMSLGSLSPEAHETIAIAMNRLGAKSNCGEGGEDPRREIPGPDGENRRSAIRQVASGRFGVTIGYLARAKEIQIKMAQGAKPGEGGQLPGHKVDENIARIRHSTPRVTLISPPPHHDIYSIEDLAQLICDLRCSNRQAGISVKLVSETGVGTIAAGVAKAHADVILISGHDGGTGASPLSGIRYAGLPWEPGIAETQQTLVRNRLRDRVRIQVDGQMKTGRDVMIAALLGAEEFGFATTLLVCLGCVMMRKCHENNCPAGVATQDPTLRRCFRGKPEYIENFLRFVAEEVREYLAQLGFRSLDEAIGRSDRLQMNRAIGFWKAQGLDFSAMLERAEGVDGDAVRYRGPRPTMETFDEKVLIPALYTTMKGGLETLGDGHPVTISTEIHSVDRTAGTVLSSEIVRMFGDDGLPDDTVTAHFTGCAGQSFGAFLAHGVTFRLKGEANDFVGKGISGGKIVIQPPEESRFRASENVIAGNVIGYGGTSGRIFLNGQAGERFAIRNSGFTAVVEGVGDHGCEYMTGGRVVVLGPVGVNFAAGMTGGIAFVYDETNDFDLKCNVDSVDLESVDVGSEAERELLDLLAEHVEQTGSQKAREILADWNTAGPMFVRVIPIEYRQAMKRQSATE